ncbi:hypothetical protein GCM10010435_94110 [Winogradskya consettensis]|uniref:Ricin B lectin domain-containing protein n=1 Tax=Winogradskya consettensis TaxID=113560 RepID=A0A919T237_9ACTN|nr:RICIN domain-containing protein [Actinoplanes consettensis]GIM84437.1 hypothetical protein Aco04nite_91380 [Actinoplanes consettensis]
MTAPPPTGEIRGGGWCRYLDVNGQSQFDGVVVQIWDGNGCANRSWTATSSSQLVVYGNKCLDAPSASTGARARIWSCTGAANQRWNEPTVAGYWNTYTGARVIENSGTYVRVRNVGSGLYLDGMGRTANGASIGQYSDSTSVNQRWKIVAAS